MVAFYAVPLSHQDAFDRLDEQFVQVTARIRDMVEFEERNLSAGSYSAGFDPIFFRNVLIYFSHEAKRTALRRLVGSLREGGYLFYAWRLAPRVPTERPAVASFAGESNL